MQLTLTHEQYCRYHNDIQQLDVAITGGSSWEDSSYIVHFRKEQDYSYFLLKLL